MRGWTLPKAEELVCVYGYPAHAGMDRSSQYSGSSR